MFTFGDGAYGGTRLWIIDKGEVGGFYNGSSATYARYDPFDLTGACCDATLQQQEYKDILCPKPSTDVISRGKTQKKENRQNRRKL
jgi:hypothetical protein